MSVEVAKAFVSIIPSLDGASGAINSGLNSAIANVSIGNTLANVFTAGIEKAMNAVQSHISGGIERLDIIENYPLVMKSLGYATEDAQRSIDKISESLDGLPSSTSEVVLSVQKLAASIGDGDLDRATDFGLALNDMLLSGGKSGVLVQNALEQMNQMIGVGKVDMMAWRSVVNAAPGQVKMLAQSLLGAEAGAMDLYNALGGNKHEQIISFDQLIDEIIRLDKEGTEALDNFNEQAYAATGGIGVALTNLDNRLNRMWEHILRAIGRNEIAGFINSITTKFPIIGKEIGKVIDMLQGEIRIEDGPFAWLQPVMDAFDKMMGYTRYIAGDASDDIEEYSDSIADYAYEMWQSGEDIIALQEQLVEAGYDVGEYGIDGILGPDTMAALEAYTEAMIRSTDEVGDAAQVLSDRTSAMAFFKDAVEALPAVKGMKSAINRVTGPVKKLGKVINSSIFTNIDQYLKGNIDASTMFSNIWSGISGGFKIAGHEILNNVTEGIREHDWLATGHTIGEGIVNGFKFVGGAIMGALGIKQDLIDEVQEAGIGPVLLEAVKGTFTGIGEKIGGWLDEVDWASVGSTIGDYIAGKLTFAKDITQKVKDFLTGNVSWNEVGGAFGEKISNALTLTGGGIKEKIENWVENNGGWESAALAAAELFVAGFSFLSAKQAVAMLPFKAAALIASIPWGGLALGAGALFVAGFAFTTTTGQSIVDKGINAVLGDDSSEWKGAGEEAGGAFSGAFEFVDYEANKISKKAEAWLIDNGGWQGLGTRAGEEVGKGFKFVGDIGEKLAEWLGGISWEDALAEGSALVGAITDFGSGFMNGLEKYVDFDEVGDRMWYLVGGALLEALNGGWTQVREAIPRLFGFGADGEGSEKYESVGKAIGSWVVNGVKAFVGFGSDVVKSIIDKITGRTEDGSIPEAEQAGRDIGQEIYNGLVNVMSDLFVDPVKLLSGFLVEATDENGPISGVIEDTWSEDPWYYAGKQIGSAFRAGFEEAIATLGQDMFLDFGTRLGEWVAASVAGGPLQGFLFPEGWEEDWRKLGYSDESIEKVASALVSRTTEAGIEAMARAAQDKKNNEDRQKAEEIQPKKPSADEERAIAIAELVGEEPNYRSLDEIFGDITANTPVLWHGTGVPDPLGNRYDWLLRSKALLDEAAKEASEYDPLTATMAGAEFVDVGETVEAIAEATNEMIDGVAGASVTAKQFVEYADSLSDKGGRRTSETFIDSASTGYKKLAPELRESVTENVTRSILAGTKSLPGEMMNTVAEMGSRINRGLGVIGGDIQLTTQNAANGIVSTVNELPDKMTNVVRQAGVDVGSSWLDGISGYVESAKTTGETIVQAALGGIQALFPSFGSAGQESGRQYNSGIESMKIEANEKALEYGRVYTAKLTAFNQDGAGYNKLGATGATMYNSGILSMKSAANEKALEYGRVYTAKLTAFNQDGAGYNKLGRTASDKYAAGFNNKTTQNKALLTGEAIAKKASSGMSSSGILGLFATHGRASSDKYDAAFNNKTTQSKALATGKAIAQKTSDGMSSDGVLNWFSGDANKAVKSYKDAFYTEANVGAADRAGRYVAAKASDGASSDGVMGWFHGDGSRAAGSFISGMNSKKDDAYSKGAEVAGKASDGLNSNTSSYWWGADMVQNFIDGAYSKLQPLRNAMATIAETGVLKLLGFSVPEEGPLHHQDEWGGHMIDNFITSAESKMGDLRKMSQRAAEAAGFKGEGSLEYDGDWTNRGGGVTVYIDGARINDIPEIRQATKDYLVELKRQVA